MKKALLFLSLFALLSCSSEKHITDTVVTHEAEINAVAKKLYRRHFTETIAGLNDFENDLTKKEMRLLKYKLRCEEVQLIYESEDLQNADSLVVFTRGGTWENEHTVVVDMRKVPRKTIVPGLIKIMERIYYRKVAATLPIS